MAVTLSQIKDVYCRCAPYYDRLDELFRLVGANTNAYRDFAIEALNLSPGDTVVDLGCGTGLNFSRLEKTITDKGHIIGVDLTDGMLDKAQHRITQNEWKNVKLIESDMTKYTFPTNVNGILSTFAIPIIVDDYDKVIQRAAEALCPGGHLVTLDMKKPKGWPEWVVRILASFLGRMFGGFTLQDCLDYAERTPWESINKYMDKVTYKEFYAGAFYVCVGQKRK